MIVKLAAKGDQSELAVLNEENRIFSKADCNRIGEQIESLIERKKHKTEKNPVEFTDKKINYAREYRNLEEGANPTEFKCLIL